MKDRQNLTGTPELGLKNAITHRDNVDDYGHLIYEALKKVSLLTLFYVKVYITHKTKIS